MTVPPVVRDVAILLARIGIGIIFFAHGWQKLFTFGIGATALGFRKLGVPLPTLSAWFSALVELLGGAALIIGLATPIAAILLVLDMLGAYITVHAGHGLFIGGGGAELVLALGAGSLLLAAVGAGSYSVDALLTGTARSSDSAHRARP